MTDDTNAGSSGAQPTLKPVCAHCGSDRIVRDAAARWDAVLGEWQLAELQDCYFCDACNGEGHVLPEWGPRPSSDETVIDPSAPRSKTRPRIFQSIRRQAIEYARSIPD